jgi:hypothetical protein
MLKNFILKLIRLYQKNGIFHTAILKQLFLTDKVCRFTPTCSEYTYQAVEKYGAAKGLFLGLKRIIRCHPFSKGGYDPLK